MLSEPAFFIGPIPIQGDLILAPMDGVCDHPTRLLFRRMGSSVTYSEFINVLDASAELKDFSRRTVFSPEERPFGFQLYGSLPEHFPPAVRRLLPLQPDFFDLNLGCSVQCVAGRGAGAGLLAQPPLIATILRSIHTETNLPVTAKMRIGWDRGHLNYLEVARMLEDNGAAALAVHGRTRRQKWSEPSEWQPIAEIKQAVSIPVIGNGDVTSLSDILRMKGETGCDAVMIGRAALGNPWLFSRVDKQLLSRDEILSVVRTHWESMAAFYGAEKASFTFRKHLKAYLDCPQFANLACAPILTSPHPLAALDAALKN
jgi:tRNA-dihydrouridine synthase B